MLHQLNYDIIVEAFRHFSIINPVVPSSRRHHQYWGPNRIYPRTEEEREDTRVINEKRRTLLAAALTCKTLSEIALDELWAAPRGGLYAFLRLLSVYWVRTTRGVSEEVSDGSDCHVSASCLCSTC